MIENQNRFPPHPMLEMWLCLGQTKKKPSPTWRQEDKESNPVWRQKDKIQDTAWIQKEKGKMYRHNRNPGKNQQGAHF